MPENAERIRELEAELAELKGQEPRPLTPAEIRAMSAEEVAERWEAVKATILDPGDGAGDVPSPTERLRRGYGDGDGDQIRRARRNK